MGFTKSIDNLNIHQALGDTPNIDNGLSAEQLKEKFDSPANKLQQSINKLIDELENILCSEKLGAKTLDENDVSDGNVQAKLIKLHKEIQDVALGDIPDGTITKAKMNVDYASTLAVKDGTKQDNLNSSLLDGKTVADIQTVADKIILDYSVTENCQQITVSNILLEPNKDYIFFFNNPRDNVSGGSEGIIIELAGVTLTSISKDEIFGIAFIRMSEENENLRLKVIGFSTQNSTTAINEFIKDNVIEQSEEGYELSVTAGLSEGLRQGAKFTILEKRGVLNA